MRAAPKTIVLLHGLWVTPRSWEHWIAISVGADIRCFAPAYPASKSRSRRSTRILGHRIVRRFPAHRDKLRVGGEGARRAANPHGHSAAACFVAPARSQVRRLWRRDQLGAHRRGPGGRGARSRPSSRCSRIPRIATVPWRSTTSTGSMASPTPSANRIRARRTSAAPSRRRRIFWESASPTWSPGTRDLSRLPERPSQAAPLHFRRA